MFVSCVVVVVVHETHEICDFTILTKKFGGRHLGVIVVFGYFSARRRQPRVSIHGEIGVVCLKRGRIMTSVSRLCSEMEYIDTFLAAIHFSHLLHARAHDGIFVEPRITFSGR